MRKIELKEKAFSEENKIKAIVDIVYINNSERALQKPNRLYNKLFEWRNEIGVKQL